MISHSFHVQFFETLLFYTFPPHHNAHRLTDGRLFGPDPELNSEGRGLRRISVAMSFDGTSQGQSPSAARRITDLESRLHSASQGQLEEEEEKSKTAEERLRPTRIIRDLTSTLEQLWTESQRRAAAPQQQQPEGGEGPAVPQPGRETAENHAGELLQATETPLPSVRRTLEEARSGLEAAGARPPPGSQASGTPRGPRQGSSSRLSDPSPRDSRSPGTSGHGAPDASATAALRHWAARSRASLPRAGDPPAREHSRSRCLISAPH